MATTTQTQFQNQTVADKTTFLRRVLRADAVITVLSGGFLMIAASSIAEFLGIGSQMYLNFLSGSAFIFDVGALLVVFGAFMGWVSSQPTINQTHVREIIAVDTAWVVISAVLLTNALALSTNGSWAVLFVADSVAVIAALKFYGLRRLNK
jgi:hypothetical protein